MSAPLFDTRELAALAADLGKVTGAAVEAVTAAVDAGGESLRERWAANIASTGGSHLPHLPDAVTAERLLGIGSIGTEVGPDASKKQGALGKGEEYGSVNTPPKMSGHKAADAAEPGFVRSLDAALAFSMKPVTGG